MKFISKRRNPIFRMSLSARRVWIEIVQSTGIFHIVFVTLREEGVD